MPRLAKAPEVRRAELIDCAQALFFDAGYEAVTIADIIAAAGVSKGGFYHYFDSKEAVLEAVAARVSEALLTGARDILDNDAMDACAKLNALFARMTEWKVAAGPSLLAAFATILRAENAALYQRIARAIRTVAAPVLTALIEDGVRAGAFTTPDSALAADMIIHLAQSRQHAVAAAFNDLGRGRYKQAAKTLEKRLRAEEAMLDRLLGLPSGAIRLAEPGVMEAMLKAMAPPRARKTPTA